MTDDEILWDELGTEAAAVYDALLQRADEVLAGLDERGRALEELTRRSAAMVDAQRFWMGGSPAPDTPG